MKRLLITGSTFPRWEGDTEPRFILDYAKAMSQYYDVTVLTPAAVGTKKTEILEGINVIRCHYFPIHKLETLCSPGAIVPRIRSKKIRILLVPFLFVSLWMKLLIISKNYDVIHSHWVIPMGICQAFAGKNKYILTGHGGDVTSLNKWPLSFLKKIAYKKASYITVVSKDLETYVKKYVPERDIGIMPMGCDTRLFSKEFKKDDYFCTNGEKAILFVGRLAEKKGVSYLIEAMRQVDAGVLYIVGKGDLEKELKEQGATLNQEVGEERVVFLGAKTHENLSEIYASADIFVAPSITASDGDKEGFGLVILEAMASGLPVVASKSGGITDIIIDGKNGLLCEEKNTIQIAEKINYILENPEIAKEFVQNGYETVKNNSYEEVAKKYRDIIENKQYEG